MPSSKSRWPETAIILAGGSGSRLGALTATTPKPLLPVAGRPFLLHLLDYLITRGIQRVILATGYLAEEFEKSLGTNYRSLTLVYSQETKPLGTGGAVALALAQVTDSAAFVLNGDTFFPADLDPLVAVHETARASLSLVLRRIPDATRYGHVTLENNVVRAMHEKGSGGPGLINGGIYLVNRDQFLADAPTGNFSLERDLFPRWIARGVVAGTVSDAYFVDIGIPADLQRAEQDLA